LPNKSDVLLDEKQIDRALTRIAHEILEHNRGAETLGLIGIWTRGAHLAKRIAAIIRQLEGIEVPVGFMDISLYRDDVHSKLDQPVIQRTEVLFQVVDRNIVLVDDVLFSGRTVRAALDQIIDFGRPRSIQLAVLIDRGHRELPIKADYVGVNIPTSYHDQVVLQIKEKDRVDRVRIERGPTEKAHSGKTKKAARKKTERRTTGRRKGGRK
jgi:pyrimidine operon attenuation protein/uracil phosphoribosyltransferase